MALSSPTVRQLTKSVVWVDHNGESVGSNLEFEVFDAVGGCRFGLGRLYGPGSVGDVGLAGGEALKACAGPRDAHDGPDVFMELLELFSDGLGDRGHGGGAVYLDDARQLLGRCWRSILSARGSRGGQAPWRWGRKRRRDVSWKRSVLAFCVYIPPLFFASCYLKIGWLTTA